MSATPEEVDAIGQWMGVALRERQGPDVTRTEVDNWHYWQGDIYKMFRATVPDVSDAIEAMAEQHLSRHPAYLYWAYVIADLPDHIIGVMMKAGGTKFLPAVEVAEILEQARQVRRLGVEVKER
jgi:hypothetical protein|tara:strand:+ start:384 stop:755 length:372 start_codon:yes stop_codon:yes gene_type:complete